MSDTNKQHEQLAITIVETASQQEREALKKWARGLLEINQTSESALVRGKKAVVFTANSKVIMPTLKIIAREIKRHGWDNRGKNARLGIGLQSPRLRLGGKALELLRSALR